ncbi:MAG: hypothetical protein RL410_686 [Actinomycetota bacterium]|jgi:membrane peptidoglycan carboxypeptidase
MSFLGLNYPRRDKRGVWRWLPSWKFAVPVIVGGGLLGGIVLAYLVNITPIPAPNEISQSNTTIVYYDDGKTEIGRIGDYNREIVPLQEIPLVVQQTVLAAEDRNFYDHSGFSISGIARAFWNNITTGSSQGGSTITQQYVKTAFLTTEQTFKRKIKELILSIKLETSSSKDEIFANYLNTCYFGRGAYGIQSAARAYFGKSVQELTASEAAMLASLLKSPEGFAPEKRLDRLKQRWTYVMDQMADAGWISAKARKRAEFPSYLEKGSTNRLAGPRGYILQEVKKDLIELGYDEASLGVAGLQVVTTINRQAQIAAEKAVRDKGPKSKTEGVRIGLVAVKPGDGAIMAMYGGPDYVTEPLNNVTQAVAQAGSTFKVFALAAAMETGTPLDYLLPGKSGTVISGYKVNNYSGETFGDVTLLQATEHSVNTAYVQLADDLGIDSVMNMAYRMGLPEDTPGLDRNLTFVLGSPSPHVIDMAEAYATLASRGVHAEPYLLKSVKSSTGTSIYESRVQTQAAIVPEVTDQVTFALEQVVLHGTGINAKIAGRPVAGKTGTTDESKSAWFVGYSPEMATAVMMMKQNSKGIPVPMYGVGGVGSVTGGSFPTKIWGQFMRDALKGVPVTKFPAPTASPTVTESATPNPSTTPTETTTATPTPTAS